MDFSSGNPLVTNISMALCKKGFVLKNPGVDRFECRNSLWKGPDGSRQRPKCIPIDCGGLPTISKAKYIRKPLVTGFKSKAALKCVEGFEFAFLNPNGDEDKVNQPTVYIVCSSNQTWMTVPITSKFLRSPFTTSVETLRCRKRQCPLPEDIQHGMVEFSGLTVGSMARYSCERPFKIEGRAQTRCLPSGSWGHDLPSCIRYE